MSGIQRPVLLSPPPSAALALSPAHLVRVGDGLDAIRVQARGYGVIIGSLGFRRVWRSLDALIYSRFRRDRCRALFVGLHGVAWVSLALPPAAKTSVPEAKSVQPPSLPAAQELPSLRVQLIVTPPEPPGVLP